MRFHQILGQHERRSNWPMPTQVRKHALSLFTPPNFAHAGHSLGEKEYSEAGSFRHSARASNDEACTVWQAWYVIYLSQDIHLFLTLI